MLNSNKMFRTKKDATSKVWCSTVITCRQQCEMLPPRCDALIQSRWRHQMETFSALLALCTGNSPIIGEFPSQRPVTRSFDILFDPRLNKRLSKQSWSLWFKTPSHSLWRHCNVPKYVQIKARSCHEVRCLKLKNCRQCKMAPGRWDTCLAIMYYREQWEMTPEW